jgi:hypothetical protein
VPDSNTTFAALSFKFRHAVLQKYYGHRQFHFLRKLFADIPYAAPVFVVSGIADGMPNLVIEIVRRGDNAKRDLLSILNAGSSSGKEIEAAPANAEAGVIPMKPGADSHVTGLSLTSAIGGAGRAA